MEGSSTTIRTPEGEAELELPLPGLYNVYNALAALAAALRLGVGLERAVAGLAGVEAAFGRVETIAVEGVAVSILLIKNPAGANEVLRTLRLEGQRSASEADGIDLWIALNDGIADGRDVSWIWDADFELLAGTVRRVTCAGTRAPEMALRLKYAGLAPELIEVEPSIGRSLDRRRLAGGRAAVRAADLHRAARAAHPAQLARPGRGVLEVSATADRETIWHEVECGSYAADLALWSELAAEVAGPVLELGCGTGRVALHLAAEGREVTGARPLRRR